MVEEVTVEAAYTTLQLEIKDGIAILTLNRPEKLNAVTEELEAELERALDELERREDVRVVILTGAGKAFSAGQDVNVLCTDPAATRRELQKLKRPALLFFEKPIIAAVNGVAAGAGADFVLMCDMVVASEHARFSFPGAKLGIACPYALIRLAEEIGRAKAKELLMTGDWLSAQEALGLRLINKVVPSEQVMDAAMELAEKVKRSAPLSVRVVKEALNRTLGGFEYSYEVMVDLMYSQDRLEGMRAFLEKREPSFKGR